MVPLKRDTEVLYDGKVAVLTKLQKNHREDCTIQLNGSGKVLTVARDKLHRKIYETIEVGSCVECYGKKAKVIGKGEEGDSQKWKVQYSKDVMEMVTRHELVLKRVSFKLFESDESFSSGIVPVNDIKFDTKFETIQKLKPSMTLDEVKYKAQAFYEAIGRVFLKIMMDDRNTISSYAMPNFYRNGTFPIYISV